MADLADELLRDLEGDDDGADGGWDEEDVDAGSPGHDGIVMPETAKKLGKRKAKDQDANGHGDDADMNGHGDGSDDDEDVQVKEEEVEMQIPEGGVRPAQELDADDVAQMQLKNIRDVSSVARLAGSKTFKEVLQVCGAKAC